MSPQIDKQAVADSFSKAANHYDQFAQLQRDIGGELLACTDISSPKVVVDLGCGTGFFSEKLANKFKNSELICFDLSTAMLKQVQLRNLINVTLQQGDIDDLPFFKDSVDLIYSNLVVQWSEDIFTCLNQIQNSLKENGKAVISTLLTGSLDELKQAWKSVDDKPHTNSFLSLETIKNILSDCHFSEVKIKTETRTLQYKNVIEVMRALKGIGANHVHGHQSVELSGKKLLKQLENGYQPFKDQNGLLNLTYQVCYIEVTK